MNILYHHRTQGTGAEGVHIGQVVKSLREIGHEVDVVSPNDTDPTKTAGNNPFEQKKGLRAKLLDLLSRNLPQFMFELLELAYNFTAKKKINYILASKKIDLIYERSAFFLFIGSRIGKSKGIPYIVEVNEVSGEERVRNQFFVSIAKKIEQEVFSSAKAIIVVSSFLKSKIESMGVDGDKIHVIPNAADASIFNPQNCKKMVREDMQLPDDSVVIGFIGWFVPWHNFDLLLEAFGQIKNKNVYLMLVGDGLLKDNIKSLAVMNECQDRLVFSGAIKYSGIPDYVNAMDICIIPGSNEYRSPIKLFEYMIMSKPVVAPRLEPIEFIARDDENVKLFTPNETSSLLSVLEELVNDAEKRKYLGDNARALILDKHLWIHNAQKVVDIYQSLEK